ncbi:hypothetical protein [Streptomyces sp. NPDC059611]|uniref:hypothetical protein n=1 Tax=Streptomyces sp. NPDC059611 TaxID=3346884 RepID=UPI00368F42D1
MSKRDRQQLGPKGQSYVAAPQLPSYDRPPASDVTIVRPDGTQETRSALAPKLSRGSYDLARQPQKTGKPTKQCINCRAEFKKGQRKRRWGNTWQHLPGECTPQLVQPVQPARPRPMGRKVPLHEKVARRFWIRRHCPVCNAKAGQDCFDPGEPGSQAVQREHGHDERIEPIVKAREASMRAKKANRAREAKDRRARPGPAT